MTTAIIQPNENKKIDFDMSNQLTRTDHAITSIISMTSSPSGLVFSNQSFSGKVVQADVSNGTDNTVPKITIQVSTNHDTLIEDEFYIAVIET